MGDWTATPPTEPGFYWLAQPGQPDEIVRVGRDQVSRPAYYVAGRDDDRDPADVAPGSLWFGPLSSPARPGGS